MKLHSSTDNTTGLHIGKRKQHGEKTYREQCAGRRNSSESRNDAGTVLVARKEKGVDTNRYVVWRSNRHSLVVAGNWKWRVQGLSVWSLSRQRLWMRGTTPEIPWLPSENRSRLLRVGSGCEIEWARRRTQLGFLFGDFAKKKREAGPLPFKTPRKCNSLGKWPTSPSKF